MSKINTDNTVLTNGILIKNKFYPKKNLQSGTMRIVLTTECNYKCKYCFAEGEIDKNKRILDIDKLKKVLKISREFGINSIKLTGGEPLLYPYIESLFQYLREIKIPYIDLTTNISLLNLKNIEMLNEYNVNALTLSLNTLNCDKYKYLSGYNGFDLVEKNLNNTIKLFKGNIRINCIIFDKDFMEKDYNDIIDFCKFNNIGLRLVEPSKVDGFPITYTKIKFKEYTNILKEKSSKVVKSACESVEYIFFGDWYITLMHSLCDNKHCLSCKEYMYLRVSSEMKLKPCLSRRDTEINIDFESDDSIRMNFIEAINNMGTGI